MTIEVSTARAESNYSGISLAILFLSCAFFFIPTTLIVLGYYSTLPTGSLISPLPQGIISNSPTNLPREASSEVGPIIAAPEEAPIATQSANTNSNLQTKTASIPAAKNEVVVTDPDILPTSQIFISNREGDKSLYSIKNKSAGQVTIYTNTTTDAERFVDYHLINP